MFQAQRDSRSARIIEAGVHWLECDGESPARVSVVAVTTNHKTKQKVKKILDIIWVKRNLLYLMKSYKLVLSVFGIALAFVSVWHGLLVGH